jgi:hypothetical protein
MKEKRKLGTTECELNSITALEKVVIISTWFSLF